MDSVFIFARTYLGIDTGWDFATGAPTGLIKDPWNIRLVPHYWLGGVLRPLAPGGRAACRDVVAWGQQGSRGPLHDRRRGHRRRHCDCDHARHVRLASPICLTQHSLTAQASPATAGSLRNETA